MTEISVTVPVYNVEKYLRRCLNTILDQTFGLDYEIICVDDGSTDNSGKILDVYEKMYPKIKVIHQKNQGLSVARNTAMEYVTGKYTMFVDSDDFIAKNTLEGLYNFAENHKSDVVIFDFFRGSAELKNSKTWHIVQILEKYGNNSFNIDSAEPFVYRFVPVATWSKFYLTDLIKDIKFEPDLNNQDVPHWAEVYVRAKNINYLPVPYYYYCQQRENSISTIRHKKAFDVFRAFSLAEPPLKASGHFERLKSIHYAHFVCNLVNIMSKLDAELRKEYIEKIKNYIIDIDYEQFDKEDFFPFEKTNMKIIRFIKENNFDEIEKYMKQKNIW